MSDEQEKHIVSSWKKNTQAWNQAIDNNQIKSRIDASNRAIIDAVLEQQVKKIIDIGCGEGWLCRALHAHGVDTLGIDAMTAFIKLAKHKHPGRYLTLDYQQCDFAHIGELFDAAVCNFSLLGEQSVADLLAHIHSLLSPQGRLLIQTLHPELINEPQHSGWREGSWDGFDKAFTDPHPWYYRSEADWEALLNTRGWSLSAKKHIHHPQSHKGISLIFIAQKTQIRR